MTNGNRSLRLHLQGTKSNRDAIGAIVRVTTPDGTQSRMVKTGSSYLAQSELAVTFGLGHRDKADRVAIEWPSGYSQEFRNVNAGDWRCAGRRPRSDPDALVLGSTLIRVKDTSVLQRTLQDAHRNSDTCHVPGQESD